MPAFSASRGAALLVLVRSARLLSVRGDDCLPVKASVWTGAVAVPIWDPAARARFATDGCRRCRSWHCRGFCGVPRRLRWRRRCAHRSVAASFGRYGRLLRLGPRTERPGRNRRQHAATADGARGLGSARARRARCPCALERIAGLGRGGTVSRRHARSRRAARRRRRDQTPGAEPSGGPARSDLATPRWGGRPGRGDRGADRRCSTSWRAGTTRRVRARVTDAGWCCRRGRHVHGDFRVSHSRVGCRR
jgi:hypothetical protein